MLNNLIYLHNRVPGIYSPVTFLNLHSFLWRWVIPTKSKVTGGGVIHLKRFNLTSRWSCLHVLRGSHVINGVIGLGWIGGSHCFKLGFIILLVGQIATLD